MAAIASESATAAFEQQWQLVAPQVLVQCRSMTRNPHDAHELYQRVAIRAWRGHASFRGDAQYLTWVVRILQREAVRLGREQSRTIRREAPLDDVAPVVEAARSVPGDTQLTTDEDLGWLREMVTRACLAGEISQQEQDVLLARLDRPGEPWEETGRRLGSTATAVAVAHCRAVPRLRVFLFVHATDSLGGSTAIEQAFRRAMRSAPPPTDAEAEAFRMILLNRRDDYSRRGWRTALRGACATVASHLDPPWDRPAMDQAGSVRRIGNAAAVRRSNA